jgi:DNA repair protein RAD5
MQVLKKINKNLKRAFLTKEDFLTVPREDNFSFDWKANYKRSTKISKIIEIVESINSSDDKIVIFSQFLGMMDFLQFDFD